jgi:hypothetical protein
MTDVARLVWIAWPAVVLLMFAALPARRAAAAAVVFGWLFLPCSTEVVPGFRWAKFHAVALSPLIASLAYDTARWGRFRPRWFDLPPVLWAVVGFFSSLDNDLGEYDAVSQMVSEAVTYVAPWLLGRLYFSDPAGLRELTLAIVHGGLVYVPLCLWELRFSPQLHAKVYGYMQHDFNQTIRFGGYRPMVFLSHGLMLGLFMTASAVVAGWMWWTRVPGGRFLAAIGGMRTAAAVLGLTAVLCKSSGALAVGLIAGALLLATARRMYGLAAVGFVVAALASPLYVGGRVTGDVSGRLFVDLVAENFDQDRADSLKFRLDNEEPLLEKAWQRPALGWGGWGRSLVEDENGRVSSVNDALWIISFGNRGLLGLALQQALLTLPILLAVAACPPRTWLHPSLAPVGALSAAMAMFTLDCIPNAMVSAIFLAVGGALAGIDRQAIRAALRAEAAPPSS